MLRKLPSDRRADSLRNSWHLAFFIVPIAAGVAGYHYYGLLGAFVYPIAAFFLMGFVLVGSLITWAWVKFLADRKRISQFSTDELRLIVGSPANADFRFAFAELETRGIDLKNVQHSLITMLASSDSRARDLGLERLRDIYPKLRSAVNASVEDFPGALQARVRSILERDSQSDR